MRFCKETVKKELLDSADLWLRSMNEKINERNSFECGSFFYKCRNEDVHAYRSMAQAVLLSALTLKLITDDEYNSIVDEKFCF